MADAIAANPPTFDLVYVISDLHIGGIAGVQIFSSAPQFTAFVEHVIETFNRLPKRKKPNRVLLVINGDFVDFLAEPGAAIFNMERSVSMLTDIFSRPEFSPVLKGLQKFVETEGTHLVITLGNHDVELALPDTRRALLQLLAKQRPELEGRIELCFDGWGYRFRIGDRRALCLHGNESDGYNFTRYDELDRIVHDLHFFDRSEFGATWRPSAGSWFVINAINPIKRQFPFVDLLKPEQPLAAAALGVLDPTKAKFAGEVARLKAAATNNEFWRPGSQRRMLAMPAPAASFEALSPGRQRGAGLTVTEIEEQAELALAQGTIDALIYMPSDVAMLGPREWLTDLGNAVDWLASQAIDLTNRAAASLTGGARMAHIAALRLAIRGLVIDEPYDLRALDEMDKAIDAGVRTGYDVVFAGHTHFRRIAKRPTGTGIYVNTGTWAGLIGLTRSQVVSSSLEGIYDALRSPDRNNLHTAGLVREECTFAEMSVVGAKQVTVVLGSVVKSGGQWTCEPVMNWQLTDE